jgi:hypothetical protein
LGRFRYTTESALEHFIAETSRLDAPRNGVAEAISRRAVTQATVEFTRAEVVAATKRREQEKKKALDYLRSHLGTAGRRTEVASLADKRPEDSQV